MWILTRDPGCETEEDADPVIVSHALLPNETYVLGRAPSNQIQISDPSVSRKHASLIVKEASIIVRDEKSAYGTYIGESAIASSSVGSQKDRVASSQEGYSIDSSQIRIRFGLHSSIWILKRFDQPKISSSSLTRGEKRALSKLLDNIFQKGDVLVDEMSDHVSYLVMREAVLTLKVASALAKGIPIVTPVYWTDFKACLASKQVLPDPNNYIPVLKESSINSEDVSLKTHSGRSSLFEGKTFFFNNKEQMSRFEVTIRYAGGKARFSPREKEGLNKILIKNELFGSIPEAHIGLAILYNSLQLYCNPNIKTKLLGSQSTHRDTSPEAIVAETQLSRRTTRSKSQSLGVTNIPPSLPSKNATSSSKELGSQASQKQSQERVRAASQKQSQERVLAASKKQSQERVQAASQKQSQEIDEASQALAQETDVFSNHLFMNKNTNKVASSQSPSKTRIPPTLSNKTSESMNVETQLTNRKRPSSMFLDDEDDNDDHRNVSSKGPPKKSKPSYFDDCEDDDDLFSFAPTKKTKSQAVVKIEASDEEDDDDLFAFQPSQTPSLQEPAGQKRKRLVQEEESSISKKTKVMEKIIEEKENSIFSTIESPKLAPIDPDGFISRSVNKSVSNSVKSEEEEDLSKSYMLMEISDLIREDIQRSNTRKSSTGTSTYNGPNFKKFRSKHKNNSFEAKRIIDLCKPEDLHPKTQEEIRTLQSFFEEDASRSQRCHESEDFWKFEVAKPLVSSKKQSTLKSFFK